MSSENCLASRSCVLSARTVPLSTLWRAQRARMLSARQHRHSLGLWWPRHHGNTVVARLLDSDHCYSLNQEIANATRVHEARHWADNPNGGKVAYHFLHS